MVKGLYAAYTGMMHQQNRMDVLTNNLANVNTNGYKKEGTTSQSFSTMYTHKLKDASENSRLSRYIGNNNPGVKIGEGYTDFSQGPLKTTNNPYDFALTDKGFFAIEYMNKSGEISTKYTRDGNFTLTNNGTLVTQDGDFVLDNNGRHITIDPMILDTAINTSGEIIQNGAVVARIQVTDFENYDYLKHFGENMYEAIEGAVETAAPAEVYAGHLETANVSVVSEMVNMISVQRAYDTNQKVITTIDDALNIAVNQLGRLGG
ncbi:MAG: flagellar basal-body rod protein FlgF [Lachnospiraceae bacterium]|nr:flagellar basal-body rod protein FlgF [Lachnospiraceae bacterium]